MYVAYRPAVSKILNVVPGADLWVVGGLGEKGEGLVEHRKGGKLGGGSSPSHKR